MSAAQANDEPAAGTLDEFRAAFRLKIAHEVEFREIDMLAHVNNVRYCEWAEHARCVYIADVIGSEIDGTTGVILARHDMQYLNTVLYREKVVIGGRITRWGGKSFDFQTEVWSEDHGRCVFRSTAVLVAYDYSTGTTIAVPEDWRRRVTEFEVPQ
jgi:acyl-CoA thioester hydrolase